MKHFGEFWFASLLVIAGVVCAGCNQATTDNAATSESEVAPLSETSPEISEALLALSEEDRALAQKQKTCPVSNEDLGSMGTPPKLEVNGQTVFICCDGCRDKLLASPDEYLSKLVP
jgi:hypothetical protein